MNRPPDPAVERSCANSRAARSFEIRPGAGSDAVAIAALATQVFLDTYAGHGVRPDVARQAFHVCSEVAFSARLAQAQRRFFIAAQGDAVLGFAEVRDSELASPVPAISGAELVRLYIQPRAQRAGVGRALVSEAERHASVASLRSLWLTAWDGNAGALAFYRRMGYADVGATTYSFESQTYGNRVLAKLLVPA